MRARAASLRAAVVLALGLAAACGGGARPATKPTGPAFPGPSPTRLVVAASEGPSATVAPAPTRSGSGESPAPRPSDARSREEAIPDHVPGTRQAPLEIELASGCVRPGGSQTITIRSKPKLQLAWATQYADGGGHKDWGGWGTAIMPPGGLYAKTWVLPPGAPQGDTRTDVMIAGTLDGEDWTARGLIHWTVAASC